MLRWTTLFITLAFIAAILGFGNVAGNLATIAKLCFFLFIILFNLHQHHYLKHLSSNFYFKK